MNYRRPVDPETSGKRLFLFFAGLFIFTMVFGAIIVMAMNGALLSAGR